MLRPAAVILVLLALVALGSCKPGELSHSKAILGAVLISDAKEQGWVAGLVIGVVTVPLTILVLLSGRHVRRH